MRTTQVVDNETLIDVSPAAQDDGLNVSVALTRRVHAQHVLAEENEPLRAARAWHIVTKVRAAINTHLLKRPAHLDINLADLAGLHDCVLHYYKGPADTPQPVTLKLAIQPTADDGPRITVMLPDEQPAEYGGDHRPGVHKPQYLVDVSKPALTAGMRLPVSVTRRFYAHYVCYDDKKQLEQVRLADILRQLCDAISAHSLVDCSPSLFAFLIPLREQFPVAGHYDRRETKRVNLKAMLELAADGQPKITVMMPDEGPAMAAGDYLESPY